MANAHPGRKAAAAAGLFLATYGGAAAPAATVGFWQFENGTAGRTATGTGSIVDSSGYGNNGTPHAGSTGIYPAPAPAYSADVPVLTNAGTSASDTRSLSFSDTTFATPTAGVTVPDSPSLALTQSLTLEAYLRPVSAQSIALRGQEQIVFRGDDRSALGPYQLFKQNNAVVFEVNDANGNAASVEAPLPYIGQWMSVAGSLDDATGTMDLYIDGTLAATATTSIRPFGTLDPTELPGVGIGDIQSTTFPEEFNGLLDEVRISNTALSAAQLLPAPVVPEPATASVLAVASIGLLGRRVRAGRPGPGRRGT